MALVEGSRAYFPDDWCYAAETMSGITNNKMYIYGGYIRDLPNEQRANTDIIEIDFTRNSGDFSKDTTLIKRIPLNAAGNPDTVFKWGAVYAHDSNLYFSHGELTTQTNWNFDDKKWFDKKTRKDVDGTSWVYNVETEEWKTYMQAFQPSKEVPNSATRVGTGFSKKYGKGFVLGGRLEKTIIQPPQLLIQDLNKENSWKNLTTPGYLRGIEFAEVLALDNYGKEGVLAVFGGVTVEPNLSTENDNPLNRVHVFDIATEQWHIQPTAPLVEGGEIPSARTHTCAVAVPAADGTSTNIYVYGGHNNKYSKEEFKATGEVWVLSVPSFTWQLVSTDGPAFYDHTCELVDDRYLVSFGGKKDFNSYVCSNVETPLGVNLFDLHELKWTRRYEKNKDGYKVPEKLFKTLGGDEDGGATVQEPEQWESEDLAVLFPKVTRKEQVDNKKNNDNKGGKDTSSGESNSGSGSSEEKKDDDKKEVPVGAIAGGVVGGIGAIALIALIVFLMRKKRKEAEAENEKGIPPAELATSEPAAHLLYSPRPGSARSVTSPHAPLAGAYAPNLRKDDYTVRSELMGSEGSTGTMVSPPVGTMMSSTTSGYTSNTYQPSAIDSTVGRSEADGTMRRELEGDTAQNVNIYEYTPTERRENCTNDLANQLLLRKRHVSRLLVDGLSYGFALRRLHGRRYDAISQSEQKIRLMSSKTASTKIRK
ncbi:hypothetical protein BJ508DRAFT_305941 [Ascobolus immersus RN42]|uniref:Kelch repeat protein n=1 Tax=Ascobolus immersus RN42 TaxID=1160509 RepID=A0A3N4I9B2_ASCIM|nr:hypothetical protein BJ508DRAFT_305941 [Ascobolus immersus RN42]